MMFSSTYLHIFRVNIVYIYTGYDVLQYIMIVQISALLRCRGALTLQSSTGMCCGHDPLFSGQSALPSPPINHQCAAHVPPSHFKFLKKFCIFSFALAKIWALKMQIFHNFVPKIPQFFIKIRYLDLPLGNLCGTHLPKKNWSAPPPRGITILCSAPNKQCC